MKMIFKKLKTISVGTWLRTLLQFLAYINQFLIILGQSPLGDNPIYIWISFAITVLITLLSYWYNNDWSNIAVMTRDIFDMLKDGKITDEEMKDFLNKYQKKKDEGADVTPESAALETNKNTDEEEVDEDEYISTNN